MTTPLYAAIDCGTNSTRLLISNGSAPSERLMRTTRLGKSVDRTGRLDSEAIERTLAVLREYRQVMDRYDVAGVRIAATSAARDAEKHCRPSTTRSVTTKRGLSSATYMWLKMCCTWASPCTSLNGSLNQTCCA